MSETPRKAKAGVADALHDLSDNSRALVQHEIAAVQKEMWGKALQAMPAVGLLGAGAFLGVLAVAASFRLSVQLLEKSLPPTVAALTAATGYGVAAGAAGAIGIQRLRKVQPLFPAETARDTVKAVADTTGRAAS